MTTTGPRKSMEDVLAAIRRIVRNEKPQESVAQRPDWAVAAVEADDDDDDAPLTLTPAMRLAPDPVAVTMVPNTPASGMTDPAPMPANAMTPDPAAMAQAWATVSPAGFGGDPAPRVAKVDATDPPPMTPPAWPDPAPDWARPVTEAIPVAELAPAADPIEPAPAPISPATAAAPAAALQPLDTLEDAVMIDEAALEDMVRRIVRDELMGEMGMRMSKNVTRLIQDEVARQIAQRG